MSRTYARTAITLTALGVAVAAIGASPLARDGLWKGANALVARIPLLERFCTRWIPPTPPEPPIALAAAQAAAVSASNKRESLTVLSPSEREALAALGRQVRGRLVWSSNRFGNHELLLVELPEVKVSRLTTHPHVDFFSRFSPDGKRISFVRSRREWVSFREEGAWDLYVMNADGSEERRLAERAYHPTWTPDGSAIIFSRENTLVRLDLASGHERAFYDGSAEPTDGQMGEASFQEDGLLALTVSRRGRQRVGVLDRERSDFIALSSPHACQITWARDGRSFLWVQGRSGNGGNRIMSMRLEDRKEEVLIDLPGKYSHEYFPRMASDGQWLVWGAAAEGHEHDRADYEMFAWKLGTPWESALRLTYSAANDQWPDFYVE